MKWNLEQISQWTGGQILSSHQTEFSKVATDTRVKMSGDIFIALKGDVYDAHQFLDQAVAQGAGALLVESLPEKFKSLADRVSIIQVKDTLKALQDFAHHYRLSLKAKVIGITGSNGKTTTKEFTAQILAPYRKLHYNQGSFNNHWGVPLTLLGADPQCEVVVCEMGMNHAGEITHLVQIAEPDIVVCTMVGTAHIEFFGTQKKIAEAKSEIYLASKPDAIRIFNQDQDLTFDMMYPVAKKYPDSRMLSFSGKNPEADVFLKISELTARGMKIAGNIAAEQSEAQVQVFGEQNLTNLMAAANLAYACGLKAEQIWKSLPNCRTSWGRNQFVETSIGVDILFDGYNANPDSMRALLLNIPRLKVAGKKIGVFGQMKELGEQAPNAHVELADLAGSSGFAQIYFVGENHADFAKGLSQSGFKGESFIAAQFESALGEKLKASLQAGDLVVIKGSRGAKTESFVDYCSPIGWAKKTL